MQSAFGFQGINQPEIERKRGRERKKGRHGDQSSDEAKVF